MKKLSNYLLDLGRVVAFYPNLKKVTGSTTATIFLCQLLYWSDKSKDEGWIWKDSNEIEEETGLTYREQKHARETLLELGIMEEIYKRLDHNMHFRINQDALNDAWELATGKVTEMVNPVAEDFLPKQEKTVEEPVAPKKKLDWVDATLMFSTSPEKKKLDDKKLIREKIEQSLHINTDNEKWNKFIDFVYTRQTKHHEPVETFLNWAIRSGFDPIYWTAEKCKTVYPQAFVNSSTHLEEEEPLPELPKEDDSVPMPASLVNRYKLT